MPLLSKVLAVQQCCPLQDGQVALGAFYPGPGSFLAVTPTLKLLSGDEANPVISVPYSLCLVKLILVLSKQDKVT